MKKACLPLVYIMAFVYSCGIQPPAEKTHARGNHVISYDISDQEILSFAEDSLGHIWIGTGRGLNKFNSNVYHQYFTGEDTTTITGNIILNVFTDSRGRIWVGAINGGICYYTEKDNFRRVAIDRNENKVAQQILENSEGRIFLNNGSRLYEYKPDSERFEVAIMNFEASNTIKNRCHFDKRNKLWSITPDKIRRFDGTTLELEKTIEKEYHVNFSYLRDNGELWMASSDGLYILDTASGEYLPVPDCIRNCRRGNLAIDNIHPLGSNMLINTQVGLLLYDTSDSTVLFQDENGFPFDAPDFRVTVMFTDSQKNIWLGSKDQGYAIRYGYKERFNYNKFLRSIVERKSVISVEPDSRGRLWLLTMMDGVYMYDNNDKSYKRYDVERFFSESRKTDDRISYLFVDNEDYLWLVAHSKVVKCHFDGKDISEVGNYHIPDQIFWLTQDKDGTMWMSTSSNNIYSLGKGDAQFTKHTLDINLFSFAFCMKPLLSGKIAVGLYPIGLVIVDPPNTVIEATPLYSQAGQPNRQYLISCLFEDSCGDVWIGTIGNGLFRYQMNSGKLDVIRGVFCEDIMSIEEDMQQNLWVSSKYGLSKWERNTGEIINYFAKDGIGGNQFYDRSSCVLADGTIFFGGTHGLTFFNPASVTVTREVPLLFQDLKVHNNVVFADSGGTIAKEMSYNPEIRLGYDQNSFSLSFSALEYSEWNRVKYKYKLEGHDKAWVDSDIKREAYYSNVPAGKYEFRVKISSNDDSIVEKENSVSVVIAPAPWNSWWARCLYVVLLTATAYIIVRVWRKFRREKNLARQAEIEKEQERVLNRMNMSFFANVSHEFRTPLTMISGPVNMLCDGVADESERNRLLATIRGSVNRMLRLVNQMLDFNKLEHDALKLRVARADVIAPLKIITEMFRTSFESKGISFDLRGLEDTFLMWIDTDKLDKIVNNLLSNALKFTPPNGNVDLCFDVVRRETVENNFKLNDKDSSGEWIKVSVADTGCGIPEQSLEKVFERYYQVDVNNGGVFNYGTGIGLYYVRRLVELHHGYIKAENKSDGGTKFTFVLPVDESAYAENERLAAVKSQADAFPIDEKAYTGGVNDDVWDVQEKKTLLVVDDDTHIVQYLRDLFSKDYNVIYRFDAASGLESAREDSPDLIVCDVAMPGMSGIEFSKTIKDDMQICHIPVILVTAMSAMEDQVKGLQAGADAYVPKPFDPKYLLALVQSQLNNRERVRTLLGSSTQTDKIESDVLSPQDKAFMTELYSIMEKEISNPELNISRMTEMLKISRSKFYYKVKGLTGENPNVFFRKYKLNRAAELILEGRHNISEIADITGFSSLAHFSRSFKRQFETNPSEYRRME